MCELLKNQYKAEASLLLNSALSFCPLRQSLSPSVQLASNSQSPCFRVSSAGNMGMCLLHLDVFFLKSKICV